MKKLIIIPFLLVLNLVFGQVNNTPNRDYISVTGTAKLELIPDEVYIGFTAKEYKKGNADVTLEVIHKDILNVLKQLNIPESNLEIENFYGSRWVSKRKIKDLYANKRYTLKVTNIQYIDKLLDKLDSINIEEIELEKITHSQIDQYAEQVKIDATKNAKKKAGLMAEGLGQTIGKAFEVIEVKIIEPYNYNVRANYQEYDKEYYSSSIQQISKINFKTIVLSYNVDVKFELK
jgi:uncharacterized protein